MKIKFSGVPGFSLVPVRQTEETGNVIRRVPVRMDLGQEKLVSEGALRLKRPALPKVRPS